MKKTQKPFVEIFADGACSGNPGVGGFGALLRSDDREKEVSGCEEMTTNNRMELMGVINALEALKRPCRAKITTDSDYVVKGMTKWMDAWIRKNWMNAQKRNVVNRDLWERLLRASQSHEVEWVWIKGHNGHPENERCDRLARKEITRCKQRMKGGEV